MKTSRFDKLLNYFPILAYLGYWFYGPFIGALIIGDPRFVKLGLVTIPAIAAMLMVALKIHRSNNAPRLH